MVEEKDATASAVTSKLGILSTAVTASFKKYPVTTPPFSSPRFGWETTGFSG